MAERDGEMEEQVNTKAPGAPARGQMFRQPRIRLGAVVALAIAVGLIAWAVIGRGSSPSSTPSSAAPTPVAKALGPVALSAGGLQTLAGAVKQPIYWAGPTKGYVYELTRTTTGKVFVRYLPAGVKAGAQGSNYLIVATYPFPNALQGVQKVAQGRQIDLPGGGIAVVDSKYPKSVHLAYPGVDYQVEVYDASPARALQIAVSGDVKPLR